MCACKVAVYVLLGCIAATSLCIFVEAAPTDSKQKTKAHPWVTDSKQSTSDTEEEITTTVSTTMISTTTSNKASDGTSTTATTDTLDGGSATESIGTGEELTLQHSSYSGDESYSSGAGIEGTSVQTTTLRVVEGTTTDYGTLDSFGAFVG